MSEYDPTNVPGASATPGGGDPAARHDVPAEGSEAEAAAVVEHDLDALRRERDELLDTSRRIQADFENYRKRMTREQTAMVERATERLVEQLLPVVDSFELAVLNLDGPDVDVSKVRKGVDLVFAELLGVLESAGLSRIEGEGRPFDPNLHEAVLQEDGDEEPVVAEVMRSGWKHKGRVLRPAMVKVSKARRAQPGDAHPGA